MKKAIVLLAAALALSARAEEGMWTYDQFPADAVARAYGFRPDAAWLEKARLASARLAQGCSASLVSPGGLLMTNHHCAHECAEQLSTPGTDLVRGGFMARSAGEERRCPNLEVNQLVAIADATARMQRAIGGLEGRAFHEAQRAEMAQIEKECQISDDLRCEVVTLHRGGAYALYTYRRFQDVRLVFAPELAIAFFGGDPDNFDFPRFDLDVAFLRVYQDGKPAATPHHFRWSARGAKEGDLTFVSGHPGRTSRLMTVAQLRYQRDFALPERLVYLAELRGLLTEYARRGPEEARHSTKELFWVENSLKALRGEHAALADPAFFRSRERAEAAFTARLRADPVQARRTLPAFDRIARAVDAARAIRVRYDWLEKHRGFGGDLFRHARTLVRAAEERLRPNGDRLREFRDTALPELTQELFADAPVFPELEEFLLAHSLTMLRGQLGADDPLLRKVLGAESPAEAAGRLVRGSRLADPALRRRLWEGGAAAVAACDDSMIALARAVDAEARAVRKRHDEAVEAVLLKNQGLLARARFAMGGKSVYPDATFTLRLSYGSVRGWAKDGVAVSPFTTFGGAFERHTGRDPFALPPSWLAARAALDPATPFNFVTTNDIIGGNSGSPVFDRGLEIVGVVFDGNLPSLGGDYWFDATSNRTVALHSAAIVEALRRVYGADQIADELTGGVRASR
jgi:hypothetical protein